MRAQARKEDDEVKRVPLSERIRTKFLGLMYGDPTKKEQSPNKDSDKNPDERKS